MNSTRCMMDITGIPRSARAEVFKAAVCNIYRSPTKANDGETLYKFWNGQVLDLCHLRVIGWAAFVKKEKDE